jgi:hypothetical protein
MDKAKCACASGEKIQPQRAKDDDHTDNANNQHVPDIMTCHTVAGFRCAFYNPLIALDHCCVLLIEYAIDPD